MKNLILTTASVLALSAFAVQAAPTQNMNDPNTSQQPGSPSSAMATDGSSMTPSTAAPSASTGASSSQMMKTHPSTTATAPAAPSASSNAVPSDMIKQHGPQKATPKHHAKRHTKHHDQYPTRMGHPQYPNEAEIAGVFVTFPPMDLNLCKPQNFCGKPECPYISYEGYFWYPEARQNLLAGYTPAQLRGMYWYPSHTHPHMVYAAKTRAVYTHPYVLNRPYPMDGAMYKAQEFPMERKWESAPDMKPGQEN